MCKSSHPTRRAALPSDPRKVCLTCCDASLSDVSRCRLTDQQDRLDKARASAARIEQELNEKEEKVVEARAEAAKSQAMHAKLEAAVQVLAAPCAHCQVGSCFVLLPSDKPACIFTGFGKGARRCSISSALSRRDPGTRASGFELAGDQNGGAAACGSGRTR